MNEEAPAYKDYFAAAVKLMQSGVVYAEDGKAWDLALSNQTPLRELFMQFGLRLVIAEEDGYAYVRQLHENEQADGYEHLPTLMRTQRLTYEQTLLCVLLRDELRRFEDEELHSTKCVVTEEHLYSAFQAFHGEAGDEKKVKSKFNAALNKVEDYGFVRKLAVEPPAYEIRPILKARFSMEQLAEVKEKLSAHLQTHGDG